MADTYLDGVRDKLDFIGERYCEHHKTNVRFYIVPVERPSGMGVGARGMGPPELYWPFKAQIAGAGEGHRRSQILLNYMAMTV